MIRERVSVDDEMIHRAPAPVFRGLLVALPLSGLLWAGLALAVRWALGW
jgi:hypothetical protein